MQNIELLAPAGDQESLIAAIQNGANAIYLGGTLFNARAFAKNFDDEQMQWAVDYAHARHVKIYVTVNTLFKDEEFDKLIAYLDRLYTYQVDALIIQDIGLMDVVKKRYPDFEIHMSTQASIMNRHASKYFEELGVSRIVLARENTLEEIRHICQNTSLEVEVFVHGALCVCYSGQCLMSSFIGKRSGNRGECAQPCRLQYQLLKDNQTLPQKYPFLLSPKDLMTIDSIGDLIDAGVTSFKVEGRMKRPEYVASVIKAYRKAIDAHLHKQKPNLEDDIASMKAMFNRDYTNGYAFLDQYIVKGDYSGNKGNVIGQVKRYLKKEKRVVVELTGSIKQGDNIVFERIDKGRPINKIYAGNRLVNRADVGEIVEIEFDYPVYEGNVRKTVDVSIIKELQKTYEKENVKQSVDMFLSAYINEYPSLTLTYQDHQVTVTSSMKAEKAIKTPLDEQRIIQQLSKLGQSPFILGHIDMSIDNNMTFPIKELNEMRRTAIEDLLKQFQKPIHHYTPQDYQTPIRIHADHQKVLLFVTNLEQLEKAIQYKNYQIFYPFSSSIEKAYELCLQNNIELGMFIPRICKDENIQEIINHPITSKINKVIVNEYGAFHALNDKERIIGTGLNIYNSHACMHYDMKKILSLEMSKQEINQLQVDMNQCIVQVYGKIENMISEYCPISQYHFGYQNKKCNLCKQANFALKDRKNEVFDLMMDDQCRMHLLNCRTLWIEHFKRLNTAGLFLHFTNEDSQTVEFVLSEFTNAFLHSQKTNIQEKITTTSGYFKN